MSAKAPVIFTGETISKHLEEIKDAEAFVERFPERWQGKVRLAGLHEKSTDLLEAMQAKLDKMRETIAAYEQTLDAVVPKER